MLLRQRGCLMACKVGPGEVLSCTFLPMNTGTYRDMCPQTRGCTNTGCMISSYEMLLLKLSPGQKKQAFYLLRGILRNTNGCAYISSHGEDLLADPCSVTHFEEKLWHSSHLADESLVTIMLHSLPQLTCTLHRCSTTKRMVVPSKEGGATSRGPVAGAVMLMTGFVSAAVQPTGGGHLLVAT